MNFLAHLHLASLADSSLVGNLLADFIRGRPDDKYSPTVVAGIYMHRKIDVLTDNLPEVNQAKQWFRTATRRVAPISLDIMWDHFLSRHWSQISPEITLTHFVERAQAEIVPKLPGMPGPFIDFNHLLWQERVMERYQEMAFIAKVLENMSLRRPKLAALQDSWRDLNDHYEELEKLFWSFYPRMMQLAGQGILSSSAADE